MVTYLCALTSQKPEYNHSYLTALAVDPTFGVMDLCSASSPDFMRKTAFMYKANTSKDPDTSNIREALTGAHREEFIQAMMDEINELQNHGTWEVVKRSDIPEGEPTSKVIPLTWVLRMKQWPSGMLRKVKACLCVRGDLQTEGVNKADLYTPVASWNSIRMLTVTALQKKWIDQLKRQHRRLHTLPEWMHSSNRAQLLARSLSLIRLSAEANKVTEGMNE